MLTLDTTTKSLEIVLTAAANTTQPSFVVAYSDIGQTNQEMQVQGSVDGVTNDTTPVSLLSAPGEGITRIVRYIVIFNGDDENREITVSLNNNGTLRTLEKLALAPEQKKQFGKDYWLPADGGSGAAVVQIISPDTPTTHTATEDDNAGLIIFDNASDCTLTLPRQSTEELESGFYILAKNEGGGNLIIALEGSDTLDGVRVLQNPSQEITIILENAGSANQWGTIGNDWLPSAIENSTLNSPPGTTPDAGAVFIPEPPATGAWAGQENEFAIHIGSDVYEFVTPPDGWDVYDMNLDVWIYYKNGTWNITTRQALLADRDYYVNGTTGSDDYNGLSATDDGDDVGPFATIQKAIDTVSMLDLSIYDVTINIADNAYSGFVLKTLVGAGTCFIMGNSTTPSNVVISGGGHPVDGSSGYQGRYDIEGVEIVSSGNGCINIGRGALLFFRNINFDTANLWHMICNGATIVADGDYEIVGAAPRHIYSTGVGVVQLIGPTITITGTPDFSFAFLQMDWAGTARFQGGTTFSGSATGKRFDIAQNAVVSLNAVPTALDYLPGDEEGTITSGAIYGDVTQTVETGITASATQTQAAATQLTADISVIATAGTNGDAVKLDAPYQSKEMIIRNTTPRSLRVYPQSGDSINNQAVNSQDSPNLPANSTRVYKAISDSQWISWPT